MKHNLNHDEWNPSLYDNKHSFVSKYGQNLIHLLAANEGELILDLGCGTGDIANMIQRSGAHVVGVDSSNKMIQQAKEKYPHIQFQIADATNLPFENQFNAVFSNAVLHWIKTPLEALQCIYKSLKTGGRFVAEFGGARNIETISNSIKIQAKKLGIKYDDSNFPWYYPSIGEYTGLMEEAKFTVTYASHFDRPTILEGQDGLKNWITMFGKMMFKQIDDNTLHQLIQMVEDDLKDVLFQNGNWIADYKRIRVIGVKN